LRKGFKGRIRINILLPLKTRGVEYVRREKPRKDKDPATDSYQNK
jgi:hypothetical protein